MEKLLEEVIKNLKKDIKPEEKKVVIAFEDYYGSDVETFLVNLNDLKVEKHKDFVKSKKNWCGCIDKDTYRRLCNSTINQWDLADIDSDDIFKTEYLKYRIQSDIEDVPHN